MEHLWDESVSVFMPKSAEEFKEKVIDMEEFVAVSLLLGSSRWLPYSNEMSTRRPGIL